jgi:hypothetical protein
VGRLRGLRAVEIVVTDALHDAGFRERMETELPGIEEDRFTSASDPPLILQPAAPRRPVVRRTRKSAW